MPDCVFCKIRDGEIPSAKVYEDAKAKFPDYAATFEAALDLGVPAGSFTWSLGIRDQPTGLVSYLLTPSRP